MGKREKIIIIEHNEIYLEGLTLLINSFPNCRVHKVFKSVKDVMLAETDTETTLVLVDNFLPGLLTIESCNQLRSKFPQAKLCVLSSKKESIFQTEAFQAGYDGFIYKLEPVESLCECCKTSK